MTEAKVLRISLVDRSATRNPFKVIKQEKPMHALPKNFDLSSVFKRAKPAAEPVSVVGVITLKSDGFESVKGQIEEAGFSVTKSAELEDGSVVFAQVEDMPADAVVVRVSEHALLALKGFSPYNMSMQMADGQSFADLCAAQGFYPGIGSMVDVLRSSVLQLAEKSDSAETTAVDVGKLFDEAKAYAVSMVSALPAMAFKLESVFPETGTDPEVEVVAKSDEAAAAEAVQVDKHAKMPPDAEDDPATGDGGKDETAEDKAARLAKMKAMKADAPAPSLTPADVAGLVSEALAEATKKMETLLSGMATNLSDLSGSVQTLTGRVESAETVAKAAKTAVESTVLMGSGAGDHHEASVVKQETNRGREIDTGFSPRRRAAQ